MSRYVDIEPLENALKTFEKRGEVAVLLDELNSVIAKYPTADVQEVVRCKDCVNWKDTFPYSTCELLSGHWEEDMYCSYGERKDG